ncbi:MAG: F0F1 ATP synthase subunit A [Candidatus Kapabacteria bacterium]|jgi:F-type H+-transporting ATPase subunit a|nr:F0F1 ATP synthase subunit A [Candidatus Kapabacteria bacterium]
MSTDTTSLGQHGNSAAHGTAHGAHGAEHKEIEGGEVFTHLISELGDHHELNIFFGHFDVLPIILIDDGVHFYPNTHAMEEAGAYTLHHPQAPHKLVSTTKVDAAGMPAKPTLDMSITNLVAYQFLAVAIITTILLVIRGKYKKTPLAAPTGLQNVMELLVVYVRDQVVRPNVGTDKRTERLMPYFTALFFFILVLNLIGLLPGAHAATGALGVTAALAITSFLITNYIAIKDAGIGSWAHHLLGGAPIFLAPIMLPIEIISLFTKPFALMIRLFANMTAGHIVILSLLGLIFFFKSWGAVPVSVAFSLFIYMLELLVAFLQAYIFVTLTAVFVGLALGDHAKDDDHGAHAH